MTIIVVLIVTIFSMVKIALEENEEDKNGSTKKTGNTKKSGK